MKRGFAFVVGIVAFATLLMLSSFKIPNQISTNSPKFKVGESVDFTFHRPSRVLDAHGAIHATGKWAMSVTVTGKAFHCINTMTFPDGEIIAISNCNTVTMKGTWHVISGTGAYEGIKGNGSLVMLSYGEEWEGTVR